MLPVKGTLSAVMAAALLSGAWALAAQEGSSGRVRRKTSKPAIATEQAKPAAPEPQIGVSSNTSIFLYPSTVPVTLETVLAHFRLYDRDLASLSARFSQELTVPETSTTQSVAGTVEYLKPNHIRIEHVRPERQTVVVDGKDIWIHRLSQNQVIQSNLEDWKKADPAVGNLMQFGDMARMLESYDAQLDTAAARPALTLRPKGKDAQEFTLRMTLRAADLFPDTTELSVGSLRIKTAFADLRFNPPLAPEAFRFSPPSGSEVFRDFKPPQAK
jgi:outer membrane lipoprotein carrier protein